MPVGAHVCGRKGDETLCADFKGDHMCMDGSRVRGTLGEQGLLPLCSLCSDCSMLSKGDLIYVDLLD